MNVQQNRLCHTSPWSWLQEILHLSIVRQRFLLLLQGLDIASQQPVIPRLVPAARYSFESMSSNILMPTAMSPTIQSILKPSCSSPSGQQKYLSLLSFQGCFVPECQRDCWMWDLNHGCSATYSPSYVWILAPIAYTESGAKQCKCGMLQVEMTLSQGRLYMQINSLKKVPSSCNCVWQQWIKTLIKWTMRAY
jgi:hypothetical protein